ncbi:hypothetical protein EB232_30760 [Mesorhizobium sp. NZP2077]|nr:hypothetical protein EB232_30760 [Mesorhizobium sp. NZP2077]
MDTNNPTDERFHDAGRSVGWFIAARRIAYLLRPKKLKTARTTTTSPTMYIMLFMGPSPQNLRVKHISASRSRPSNFR